MSKLHSAVSKLGRILNKNPSSVANSHAKLTPDEVELMAHERRAYLDNVKIKLHQMRKNSSMLNTPNWEKKFGEKKHSLLDQKSLFKQKSTLNKKPSILNGRVGSKRKRRRRKR